MSGFRNLALAVGTCALIPCFWQVGAQAGIEFNLVEVGEDPSAPSLWICEWIELPTEGGETLAWVVHANEDIPDLEFGTWDNTDYLVPGWSISTFFDRGTFDCTYAEPGGPPGGPQQPYWQQLHLEGGPGLPECTYIEISISHVPELQGVPQNVWVHATPEPATLGLLALGGLVLVKRRH